MQKTMMEPARATPIAHEADLCVVGGSCTGVFAAVRAARLGARVALIEQNGCFGGTATAGLVNVWHSLYDIEQNQQIIGGLTDEMLKRLLKRDAIISHGSPSKPSDYTLNTEELKIELDALVVEAGLRPFLHARCVATAVEHDQLQAVIIEDKTGRRAIKARYFIDATGDGDLAQRAGLSTRMEAELQPPTACALLEGLDRLNAANPGFELGREVFNPAHPEALRDGHLWAARLPGLDDLKMVAGTRVNKANCADADQLTQAEMEGRRQVRRVMDILRRFSRGNEVYLRGLPSYLGIRETRHAVCLHQVSEKELLHGQSFPDTIAHGAYPIDIHYSHQPGVTIRYLDGREIYYGQAGTPPRHSRWRPAAEPGATFYQIPYRALVPRGASNLLVAGRLVDADPAAYGAIRVMVNCNQTGEAAGVASFLALDQGLSVADVSAASLRKTLRQGGSIMLSA